jgi:multidrug resistance efflux pump
MKRSLVKSLGIGLTGLVGLGVVLAWPRPPLDSAPTDSAAPRARLVCSGYVDTSQGPLLLRPSRAGRVVEVLVKANQTVSRDTPLLQLDDRTAKLREQEAEQAVEAAQLQLDKARRGLKQYQAKRAQAEAAVEAARNKVLAAQHTLDRKQELLGKQLINKVEVEVGRDLLNEALALKKAEQNKLAELESVDPHLEVKLAGVQLERCRSQRELARQEREEHVLKAPVEGLILRVQAQKGDLMSPTSPRPAVWLAPRGAWIVRAEVSQEFADRVREGLAVQVEDESSGSELARGTITEISDWFLPRRHFSLQPTSSNTGLTLECLVHLDKGHTHLRLGQRVRVRVLADQPASQADR